MSNEITVTLDILSLTDKQVDAAIANEQESIKLLMSDLYLDSTDIRRLDGHQLNIKRLEMRKQSPNILKDSDEFKQGMLIAAGITAEMDGVTAEEILSVAGLTSTEAFDGIGAESYDLEQLLQNIDPSRFGIDQALINAKAREESCGINPSTMPSVESN
ncbi:hypothetical protein R84981_000946 [Carnimonas sp. R-84981]|uniref:hypothetical protein n=1 Tax=Carnimonas bestiolae TaxID=3402172 RepID=UPI003EDBF4FE